MQGLILATDGRRLWLLIRSGEDRIFALIQLVAAISPVNYLNRILTLLTNLPAIAIDRYRCDELQDIEGSLLIGIHVDRFLHWLKWKSSFLAS